MKRKSAINRVLLALTGIVLLGSGILILAGGFDLYRRWRLTPPDGWPLTAPDGVLLDAADRTRWTDEGWWWPVVIAVLTLVVVLAVWWLLAQLRRTHPGHIPWADCPSWTVWNCASAPSATLWPPTPDNSQASRRPGQGWTARPSIRKPTSTSPLPPTAPPAPPSRRWSTVRWNAPASPPARPTSPRRYSCG